LAGTVCTAAVTALSDTSGNNLGITCGDTVTLSYVVNGAMITCTATVDSSSMCMTDFMACFTSLASTAAGGGGATVAYCASSITMTATCAGTANAIYGVTFTVNGSDGTENSTAGNALSGFSQTSAATNTQCNGSATVLIGANTGQTLNLSISNMSAGSLGVGNLNVESQSSADVAIKVIDTATATVSAARGKMGAEENRLEHTMNNLTTSSENITAAESRIRDVDMASEMATYTKLSVINQAATAMLAQANSQPEQVLTLLK
jgi:flagellin